MKLIDDRNYDLPLLAHPLDLESDSTPQALIEAVRTKRGLASVAVPEVCILEFDGDITDHLVESGAVSSWRNWACFHTPMFALEVDGKPCGIVPRAIGGSYAVLVAEQLLASGARVICRSYLGGTCKPEIANSEPRGCECCHSGPGHVIPLSASVEVSGSATRTDPTARE